MNKFVKYVFFVCLIIFCCLCYAYRCIRGSISLEEYLQQHGLVEKYDNALKQHQKYMEEDKKIKLQQNIRNNIKSDVNDDYKSAYLENFINRQSLSYLYSTHEFINKLGVRYDPEYTIKYLENLSSLSMAQKLQLLVLWQVKQPQKIHTSKYKELVSEIHSEILHFIENKEHRFARWYIDEYLETVGYDVQFCYADLHCLLKAIPYWADILDNNSVFIPCDVAQKYNKVSYFDEAFGGHGAQSFMTSDCDLYPQFSYNSDLNKYINVFFYESLYESSGSNRFYYQAEAVHKGFQNQYRPNFDIKKQDDWTIFPYTAWAVQSYYNFKKFNDVLNSGIGYKKAVSLLTEFYKKAYGADTQRAYNKALQVLNPPSSEYWERITPDNLYYLLLSGADWSVIKEKIPEEQLYDDLLEFSIAYPQTLAKIIEEGKKTENFNIDKKNYFGKTPLMFAAQYGYVESVKILLNNGADINHQTNLSNCSYDDDSFCIHNGERSALMYALQERQFETAKYLLEQGADTTLTDSLNQTAYDYMVGNAPKYAPVPTTIVGGEAQPKESFSAESFSDEELKYLNQFIHPQAVDTEQSKFWEGRWEFGRYEGSFGDLTIENCQGKQCYFEIGTVNGSHTCHLEGILATKGNTAYYVDDSSFAKCLPDEEALIKFELDPLKNVITVANVSSCMSYCGMSGYYEGKYENEKNPLRFKTSFDCWDENLTLPEKIICGTEDLATADVELNNKFGGVSAASWITKRESCQDNTDCLWELYVQTIREKYLKVAGNDFSLYKYVRHLAENNVYYPTDFVLLNDYLIKNMTELYYQQWRISLHSIFVKDNPHETYLHNSYGVTGLYPYYSSEFYINEKDEIWLAFVSANLENGEDECFIVYAPQGQTENDIPQEINSWIENMPYHENKCIKMKYFA